MADQATFKLRWKGTVTGPFPLARITDMLRTGEISLLHNIEVDGKWTTVRDYFRSTGLTRAHTPGAGFAAPLSPYAIGDEPPPPPGAPGTDAHPTPLRRRLSPSEILERSVREGYLWCGATFLLPPIFALMVFPMSWLQNRPVNELRSFDLAAVFILATLIGSFLPLIFVRRIGATLTQAGLKEEGEAQTKLAVILGFSGAILWLAMCGWYLSHRL
ncbi:hypothetical protein LBMAG55_12390 [Verrucomicrobiota bacterium]|nr:hypothetical protein LBMAG55_12390 [Verrucomicrobiota bacterium]